MLCFILLGVLTTQSAVAQALPATIFISEIYYDAPGSDTGHEWLELTNPTELPVTIGTGSGTGSWRLFDTSNHTLTLITGSATLAPGESAIVAQDPTIFLADHPGYTGSLFKSALSLPNSNATLKLSADKGQTWFHEIGYSAIAGGNGDGLSLTWQADTWQPSSEPGGNPGIFAAPAPPADPLPERTPPYSRTFPVPTGEPAAPTNPAPPQPTPTSVPPQPVTLLISEVMYDPAGNDSHREWLEFLNRGSTTLELPADLASRGRLRVNDDNHRLELMTGQSRLHPGDYLVIADDSQRFLLDYPDFTGTLLDSSFSLPNQGAIIQLSLDSGETWLITDSYEPNKIPHRESTPLERDRLHNWRGGADQRGSPGLPPAEGAANRYTLQLVISEFLPRPEPGAEEWIELQNVADEVVSLAGWQLDDAAGGSGIYTFPKDSGLLNPGEYILIPRARAGIVLGNTRDEVRLLDPNGHVTMTIPYGNAPTGAAWMRDSAGLGRWTTVRTPGAANQLIPAIDLKGLAHGTKTTKPRAKKSTGLVAKSSKKTGARVTAQQRTAHPPARTLIAASRSTNVDPPGTFPTWTKWLPWAMMIGIFLGIAHLSTQKVYTH